MLYMTDQIIKSDPFWLNDFTILIEKNRLIEFFPTEDMSINEKLNAITRLMFYISLVLIVYTRNYEYFFLFILTCIFVILLNKYLKSENIYSDNQKIQETFEHNISPNSQWIKPTKENPFMNVSLLDYGNNPNRNSENIKDIYTINKNKKEELNNDIEEKFNFNLYRDVSDVFGKMNSQREFYTTPVTTIPNNQEDFANWCYKTGKTCKENNGEQCLENISFQPNR